MPRILHAHRAQFDPRKTWGTGPATPIVEFLTHPPGGAIDAVDVTAVEGAKAPNVRGLFRVQVGQLVGGEFRIVSTDEEIRSIAAQETVELLGFKVIEPDLPLFVRLIPILGKTSYATGSKVLVTVYLLEDEAR